MVGWTLDRVGYKRTLAVVPGRTIRALILSLVRLAGSRGAPDRLGRPHRAVVAGWALARWWVRHGDVLVAGAVVAGTTQAGRPAEPRRCAVVSAVTGRAVAERRATWGEQRRTNGS